MEPTGIIWFVCRSLGKSVVQGLRAAGEHAEYHDSHFAADAPDEEWLPEVAARGWVMLSKDKAIRIRANERDPFIVAGGRAFFLSSGKLDGEEQTRRFVRAIPQMVELVQEAQGPFMATVGAKRVERLVQPKRKR